MKKLKLKCMYIATILITLGIASLGSRVVTVIAQGMPLEREHCFIIDPGHGGVDGGATSCTGMLESAFNLEIGLRLRDMLHFLGYRTKMTRTEDISIYTEGETIAQKKISDLRARVKLCEETDGAVLLSIHQNTFPDSHCSGAQIFYSSSEKSKALAEQLQNTLGKRTAKRAQGVYLIEHITCPGVLIECGFLSNPEEEAKLRSPEYQKKLCSVIALTIVEFVNKS